MTEENQVPETTQTGKSDAGNMANIVYILYLVAIIIGLTGIVGVVIAYINRGDAPDWVRSHYTFQIRTFWITLLGTFISALLMVVFIGWVTWLALMVWLIVRCVKGMKWLSEETAVPNETSWLFGDAKAAD